MQSASMRQFSSFLIHYYFGVFALTAIFANEYKFFVGDNTVASFFAFLFDLSAPINLVVFEKINRFSARERVCKIYIETRKKI